MLKDKLIQYSAEQKVGRLGLYRVRTPEPLLFALTKGREHALVSLVKSVESEEYPIKVHIQ